MPNTILLAERVLLQTLCFDLQIVHPYKACLDKARLIKREFHDTPLTAHENSIALNEQSICCRNGFSFS